MVVRDYMNKLPPSVSSSTYHMSSLSKVRPTPEVRLAIIMEVIIHQLNMVSKVQLLSMIFALCEDLMPPLMPSLETAARVPIATAMDAL